jgi:crotonobetainyl-CoA:carnitine CoA-transferase CaiB-like acyl-CoA transferase
MMTYQAARYFATGAAPGTSACTRRSCRWLYRAADAYFNLAVGTEDLMAALLRGDGARSAARRPRFAATASGWPGTTR